MQQFPRGTVTFLFTDIEASTRLWHDWPDTMPAAYDRHDAILREEVEAGGGVVYKTVGDAFQIVFPDASGAVHAARNAQRKLQSESWPMPEPLRLRMALHTGAVDPDASGDYRSPVLNRLGRLLGAAHGGQILLSQVTSELARDHLPADTSLLGLGEQRLKDLYRPELVFQLAGNGLLSEFPPLRTLDARPNNLPIQLTQLIGREEEIARLIEMLQRDNVRLVTLIGPGGMGKTRLGLQVGADVLDLFEDGVYLVPLEKVTDPALVPSAIGQSLDLLEDPEIPMATALRNYLQRRNMLLVLDNLEQVIDGATFIGELLIACPGVKVLATSRIRLQVRGEHEFPLQPLRLPEPGHHADANELTQFESVRLFIERAVAVKPAFTVTNANAPAIAEICTRLDGLPLAIELAAARIRMLPPEAMLQRLSTRLPLLTGGARDLPARQQTLRGAIAWSHELLIPEDQALFRRLAVFTGGATLDAIEAVAAGDGPAWEVFDGLERLVDQSLVRQTEIAGEPRFSMFETIREFGLDALVQGGEAEEAHRAHATWFAEVPSIVDYDAGYKTSWPGLDRISSDLDNIRAAGAWALAHEPALAWRLLSNILPYWGWRPALEKDRLWMAQVITCDRTGVSEVDQARVLTHVAFKLTNWTSPESVAHTRAFTEEGVRISRTIGADELTCRGLSLLAMHAQHQGDSARVIAFEEEGIALARTLDKPTRLLMSLNNAGYGAYMSGNLVRARAFLDQAYQLMSTMDEDHIRATLLNSIAELLRAEGDLLQSEEMYAEAAAAAIRTGLFDDVAVNLMGLVLTAAATGRWERSAWLIGVVANWRNSGMIDIDGDPDLALLTSGYDQAVARTVEALGKEAFARRFDEGARKPGQDAVEEAISTAMKLAR